jgi:hypothetical protein
VPPAELFQTKTAAWDALVAAKIDATAPSKMRNRALRDKLPDMKSLHPQYNLKMPW